ncbi:hypothetical protein GH714_037530 [Hevea brasiliensis]|uniref:F-box domain-containing protein n=1 Tax=Hevea brasiliensis TaxID=3981 RepID=A0A6A6K8C2_HEVBR|nr:hypothetical protein GH714_037530 [Hevea brasiliensis]
MKIWCCLCFTFEDEEAPLKSNNVQDKAMREGIFENDNNPESNIENNAEETAATRLALALTDNRLERDDQRGQGESSSSTAAAAAAAAAVTGSGSEDCDRDMHNKRAKVYSGSRDCHYTEAMSSDAGNTSSSADRDFRLSQSSSVPSRNEISYHNFMWNYISDENPCDSSGGRDDGDEGGTSKSEDLEVRMDLTDDLLHMVFSFLDHINLCQAAMVCRQWRAASAHEDFWRCLNFENRNISVEQLKTCVGDTQMPTEVNVHGAPNIHLLVMKAVSSLRNLEVLTLGRGQLGDLFFHALAECNMLKSLNVNDATLGNGVQEIPINHDRLCHLQLTKCRVVRISVRCPQLETLSLKRSNIAQAVLSCPLLRLLDIGSCHKLSDAAIRSAATSCPQLESLDMSNCSCVSDETLREVALTCVNLHILDASYCPNISLESVRLPMLTVLKLHSCEGITSASMAAISRSYMLEVLELDNCNLLTSVSLDLPRLQNIRLVHCRKFADLNLRSIMLSSIMVSNCPALHPKQLGWDSDTLSITNAIDGTKLGLEKCNWCTADTRNPSLTAVQFCSTSLVSLSLVGCRAITALELMCPCLEKVCLDGCDHLERASFSLVLKLQACKYLTDKSLEPLYKEGVLTVLQELDLSYGTLCQSAIEELLACCTHLTHLSLNGCVNMHDLNWEYNGGQLSEFPSVHNSSALLSDKNINEPIEQANHLLQNLNCSCNIDEEDVEAAVSRCSMLETLDVRFCPKLYRSHNVSFDINICQLSDLLDKHGEIAISMPKFEACL